MNAGGRQDWIDELRKAPVVSAASSEGLAHEVHGDDHEVVGCPQALQEVVQKRNPVRVILRAGPPVR